MDPYNIIILSIVARGMMAIDEEKSTHMDGFKETATGIINIEKEVSYHIYQTLTTTLTTTLILG